MNWDCHRTFERETTTLEELKEKVLKITEAIKSISDCEISDEVKALAIKELQEKKAELVAQMHQMVDAL